MDHKKALLVSETIAKIQTITGFSYFLDMDESAVFGFYVTGKYNQNKVLKSLSKINKKMKLKHIIINEKAIVIVAI